MELTYQIIIQLVEIVCALSDCLFSRKTLTFLIIIKTIKNMKTNVCSSIFNVKLIANAHKIFKYKCLS